MSILSSIKDRREAARGRTYLLGFMAEDDLLVGFLNEPMTEKVAMKLARKFVRLLKVLPRDGRITESVAVFRIDPSDPEAEPSVVKKLDI